MASLLRSKLFKDILPVYRNQVKCKVSYAYPDWKPGPYPKTKEEREAAAKKYGLLPEEYEPYPDDGSGLGDYPKLPWVSEHTKDPNLVWSMDSTMFTRNHGEPIHPHILTVTHERYDTRPSKYTLWQAIWNVFGKAIGGVFVFFFVIPDMAYQPFAPKQLPNQGVSHYSFDLVEE